MIIETFIKGTPIPQGSKTLARGGGKVWLRDANAAKLKQWRQTLAWGLEHFDPIVGPVSVTAAFVFERPKSVRRRLMSVKPDLDKLARSLGDALTDAGVIEDDARIVHWHLTKRYAGEQESSGVHLTIQGETE